MLYLQKSDLDSIQEDNAFLGFIKDFAVREGRKALTDSSGILLEHSAEPCSVVVGSIHWSQSARKGRKAVQVGLTQPSWVLSLESLLLPLRLAVIFRTPTFLLLWSALV